MEFHLQDRVFILNEHFEEKLTRAQALWRGILTRKRMLEVRQRYEELFRTLEENPFQHVVWHHTKHICAPEWKHGQQIKSLDSTSATKLNTAVTDTTLFECVNECDPIQKTSVSSRSVACETDSVKPNVDACIGNDSATLDEIPCHDTSVQMASEDCVNRPTESGCLSATDSSSASAGCKMAAECGAIVTKSALPSNTDCEDVTSSLGANDQSVDSKPLSSQERQSLQEERSNVAMELLWIQQAIESRKQYLRLKTQMVKTS